MKLPLVLVLSTLPLLAEPYGNTWSHIKPVVRSEVQKLDTREANGLLAHFCATEIQMVDRVLECATRDLGPLFAAIVDKKFRPEAVIYGHFPGRSSEDAVVSGWSAEHHPELWRGTLLLSKRAGVWMPVWYKSSVITRSCRKLSRPDMREVLLCEEEDGGMGHSLHYLYSVDLQKPADIRSSPLVVADSYKSSCASRNQEIRSAEWTPSDRTLSVVIRTSRWNRSSANTCVGDPEHRLRPPLNATLRFYLDDAGFRRVQGKVTR